VPTPRPVPVSAATPRPAVPAPTPRVEIIVNTPVQTPAPAETFVVFDEEAGRVKVTVQRPAPDQVVLEWDAQPVVWKIRGKWTKGQISEENDYKIALRSNITLVAYKVLDYALRSYPTVENLQTVATAVGKLPAEITAYPGRTLLTMSTERSTIQRLGWNNLQDLFPPKEKFRYSYQEYLRFGSD
jgi:hypothetical protein